MLFMIQCLMVCSVWVRRLRAADKYETKHGRDIVDNNKPYGCVDWIRCSSATCGKWRACLRGMNAKALRKEFPVKSLTAARAT